MATPLPNRRSRSGGNGGPGLPKGAIVAVTITVSILAAFALGVLVGRSQTGSLPQAAPAVESPAPATNGESQVGGPPIEMIRPDGQRADVQPMPTPGAPPTPDEPDSGATDAPPANVEQILDAAVEEKKAATPAPSPAPAAKVVVPAGKPTPIASATSSRSRGIYTVQIAAFRDRESAERLSLTLESRGYDAYVQRSAIDGKGIWYRVRVGAFEDKEKARSLAKKLEAKEGRSAYVTIR